jgi:hypothetical protein
MLPSSLTTDLMTSTTAGLALVVGLIGVPAAGCRSASADHAADARRMIAALTQARDAVCGCGDLACAEAAEQRLADFLLLHVERFKKIPAPRANVTVDPIATQAAQLDGELRACKQRLEGAARAS